MNRQIQGAERMEKARRRDATSRLATSVLAALLVAGPLAAQDSTQAIDPAAIEEGDVVTAEARAVVDRMTAYLKGLQTFEVTASSSRDEVLPFGYKLQNNETYRMIGRSPNRLRVDVDGDIKHRAYYYDGQTLTMVAPDDNVYARNPAPETTGALINGLLNAGVELPLIDVLRQAYAGTLLDGVKYGLVVGQTEIEGRATDHLAFRQPSIDWQIWVAKNGEPRKLLITTRYEVGDPQYQAVMKWKANPRIADSTFTFTPPKDAREIPFDSGLPAAPEASETPETGEAPEAQEAGATP